MKHDLLASLVRRQLKRLPEPHSSHYGVVVLPPPEHGLDISSISKQHEAAVAAMARADVLAATASPYTTSRILVRQEAVSSSSIEGTDSTLDELLSAEETRDAGATADTKQVRDYALLLGQFIDRARSNGPGIFTLDLIRQLHSHIMREDRTYRDTPGNLRSVVVWIGNGPIGNSTWNAPPPENVEACLEESLAYMRNEGMHRTTQSFITRMAVAHAHFESVHPFRDGNGRAGRILMPLAMAAEGHLPLYLSPYIETHKGGYYGALKKAQQQLDWTAIIAFMCNAVIETVAHLEDTLRLLSELRLTWIARKKFRRNSTALRALDVLIDYPVITARRLESELDVRFAGASDALAQLVDAGIVTERTGHKRNRVFVAQEVLEIVDRPFDDAL